MAGSYVKKIDIQGNIDKILNQLKNTQKILDELKNKDYKINLNIDDKKLENIINNLDKMLTSLGKGSNDFHQFKNLSKQLKDITNEVKSLSSAFGKIDNSGTNSLLSSVQNIDKSLTSLSEHILSINKDMSNMGGNTSGAVKQVENIGNAAADAVKQVDKLVDAQSKLGNKTNISNGMKDAFQGVDSVVVSSDSVTNAIKKENSALEQNTQKAKENAEATEKQIQKKRELALSYTRAASSKLSKAISKYSYGNTSRATSMRKQMNIGVSNFKEFPNNIDGRITELDSIIENIITKLRREHEENLRLLNTEIQTEETIQKQKEAFNKSNLNSIDLEIKKREEEAKSFSNSLKAQMEQKVQFSKQLEKINSVTNTHSEHLGEYQSQSKRNDFAPTNNFLNNISNYEAAFKELQNFAEQVSQQDFITDKQLQKFEELKKRCKEAHDVLKNMKASDKGSESVSIEKLIDRINSDLKKNSNYSAEAKQKIKEYLKVLQSGNLSATTVKKITSEWLNLTNAEKLAGREGKSFFDIFKEKSLHGFIGQMQSYLSMYVGFYGMVNAVKKTIDTVVQLDDALVDLKKTTAMSGSELNNFYFDANDVAKQMGVTTQAIIEQASAWSRLNKIGLLYGDI